VQPGIFAGRARPSGAKGCVLSDLVPSGAGKPGYATPCRESSIANPAPPWRHPDRPAGLTRSRIRSSGRTGACCSRPSGAADCRNRSRLSLLEPVGEGGGAAAGILAGARGAPTQAEWAGGRVGGDLDPAEGGLVVLQSATQAIRPTPHATGDYPNPAGASPTPVPSWLDPSSSPDRPAPSARRVSG
jgi:hypothetical protein